MLKKYFENFDGWLEFAVVIFIMMQFLMPSFFVYSFWFYLSVALPYLVYLRKNLQFQWLKQKDFIILAMLFLYCAVHSTYFVAIEVADFDIVRHCLLNAIFVAVMVKFHAKQKDFLQLMRLLLVVLIVGAIISLVIFVIKYENNLRLEPFAQNNHAILGANIYSAFALAGSVLLCFSKSKSDKILSVVALLLTLLIVLLTQSRGALIAFGFGVCVLLLCKKQYIALLIGGTISASLGFDLWSYKFSSVAILPFDSYYDIILQSLSRRSHRTEIWSLAWDLIQRKPWFGYGLQANFPYGYAGVHPHNLFISTWYYTGIFGAVLLVATTIAALINLYKNRHQPLGLAGLLLLAHGIVACLTDQGQLMKSPAPLWFIFWWGVAIAYSFNCQKMQKVEQN